MIPKSLIILGHRPFVNGFFKQFPQYKQFKTFSPKPFTDLVHSFHQDFIDFVLNNREGADLPLKMGNLKIVSYKPTKKYLNFNKFKEGLITTFSNNHTEGLNGKIVYSNSSSKYSLKDKIMWAFEPEVPFKKKASCSFVKNYLRYIFSPNRGTIKHVKHEMDMKEIKDVRIQNFLKNHNEFYIA